MLKQRHLLFVSLLLVAACAPIARANAGGDDVQATMSMLRHAISVQTVEGKRQVPELARYLAAKLEAGGFPKSDIEIIPVGDTAALVARYRGTGKGKPILLSGHMDVVPANPAEWTDGDPFKLAERDGWLYGRGVDDMKESDAILIQTLIRLKREHFVPSHDLILLLSGDEETSQATTRVLVKRFHDAEFLLNADAGGGILNEQGVPAVFRLQTAEKTYADFELTATSHGGHSSEPDPKTNTMYHIAKALDRISTFQFPVQYNETTRASLKATGEHGHGRLAEAMVKFAADPTDSEAAAVISSDPATVGQIRTTCIGTMMEAGVERNVLPKRATANINCRIFPGESVASVQAALVKAIGDADVKVTVRLPAPVESPVSPLLPKVMDAVTAAVHEQYPGLKIVPVMSSGASDSMYFRRAGVLCYGLNFMFAKPGGLHAHGVDERIRAGDVPKALKFWHSLLTTLAR
jgi:acetylornithine deacetylase/succinyl-diaminopimelate desuccinylase-like protein